MFYAKFVNTLLIKQHNCKNIQWRPDGEYYRIELAVTGQCQFPFISVKGKNRTIVQ
jgi:hypothetical protein